MKIKNIFLTLVFAFSSNYANAYNMNDIGTLGGLNSSALAVSYDGAVVVGKSGPINSISGLSVRDANNPYYGFVYNQGSATMLTTGVLNSEHASSARGVSGDGSVAVGSTYVSRFVYSSFSYSPGGVISNLDSIATNNYANAASFDGSVIVGRRHFVGSGAFEAYKYSGGEFVNLGLNGKGASEATAISSDGSIIAGKLFESANLSVDPFKTFSFIYKDSVMNTIESTIEGYSYSQATGLSSDGSIMVGFASNGNSNGLETRAFQYKDNAMIDIGTLGGSHSRAYGVSGDGQLIVGESDIAEEAATRAFLYNARNGVMTDLGTLGGTNSSARAISGDGKFIVGQSNLAGDASFHAFIVPLGNSGGFGEGVNMVDLDNSITSVAIDSGKTRSLLNYGNLMLNFNLDQDAKLFGKRNIHVGLGSRYTKVNSHKVESVAATLKLAYLFNSHFRAGVFLDQALNNTMPENYSMKRSAPGKTFFATLSENQDDLGWQLHVALSQDSNSLGITRSKLENTESGKGVTNLKSKGSLVEISRGFGFSNKMKLQPYIGLRHTQTKRLAYQESNDLAFFPISYSEIGRKSKTALFGARFSSKLKETLELRASAGFEHDINSSFDDFSGSVLYLGDFNFDSGKV